MSTTTPSRPLDWPLLARYLRPWRGQLVLLAVILAGTIAVQVATPLAASRFIDEATGDGAMRALLVLALLTLVLALLGQALSLAETWIAERVAWGATNALREDLAARLLHLDSAFHHAHTPGELIERVDGDIGTLARLFSRFAVYVLGNAALIAGVLGVLWWLDWRVGLGLTLFVSTALATVSWIRAAATRYSVAERQVTADAYGFLGEYLSGLEDVRTSGAGPFVLRRWAGLMQSWLAAKIRARMRGYAMVATTEGLFGLAMAFALGLSALLYRDGALTIGAVFLVFRLTQMLRQPTEQIRNEVQDLQQAGASLGRIAALLARQTRIVDGPRDALPPGPLSVDVDRVSFGYSSDTPVLRDVSFQLPPRRILGIVGRTGSGKSTLTRLFPRFHDPGSGTVRLGGVDLRDASVAAIRSRIGIVTQESHLFDASLRDNLTLFDDGVADARLLDVLNAVGMTDWFGRLPAGLDTRLGLGGTGLSSGETQIIACTRVLLRDPDLVILDEPSSRIDPATERAVHLALARLLEGRTGIVVAHRLQTIDLATDVLILDGGRVIEQGSRADLAADPTSRYAAMLSLSGQEVAR